MNIDKETQLCMSLAARPGNFGTRFHNFLYRELGLNFIYKAFTTSDLKAAIHGLRALGIRGCGISMPFKEAVIEFIDEMMPSARTSSRLTRSLTTPAICAPITPITSLSCLCSSLTRSRRACGSCSAAAAAWRRPSPRLCATRDSRTA